MTSIFPIKPFVFLFSLNKNVFILLGSLLPPALSFVHHTLKTKAFQTETFERISEKIQTAETRIRSEVKPEESEKTF